MHDLPVPEALRPYMPLIVGSVTALLIFIIGTVVASWAYALVVRALTKRKVEASLVGFLASLTRWLVLAAAVIVALERVGLQTTSLVALLGSAGIAIGLALQGNLSHFASGVMILLFRPFCVGDYIEAGGKEGSVDAVDFKILAHCKPGDYAGMLHEVRTAVYEDLAAAGIEIPFNQIVVHQG
jgi:small conductance mechanosensitive channel